MTTKRPTSDLNRVRAIRNLRQAKQFLGMSWREMATHICRIRGHGESVGKSMLFAWANGTRIPNDEQFYDVARMIAQKLTARYGFTIGVKATRNSPWRITPMVECTRHPKGHELKRANQKRCGAR